MNNEEKGDSFAIQEKSRIKSREGFFGERPLPAIEIAPRVLRHRSRRDLLVFGLDAVAALAGAGFLLPQETLSRIGIHRNIDSRGKEWFLNKASHR